MYKKESAQDVVEVRGTVLETPLDIAVHELKANGCDGTHQLQALRHVGTMEIYICLDPQCAEITAKCTHQVEIPEVEDTKPRKFVKTACEWNEDGTVLLCTFCGKDGT